MLLVQGDDGATGINRHVGPLRFAIRLHAFLMKWYATVTTAANRTTTAIQIQKTGVELSMSTPQAFSGWVVRARWLIVAAWLAAYTGNGV
jgi:hypothetical protein